jgi:anti-sigma-K factor RskA
MSAADHSKFADLVASVALGAATPEETAALERHAATCLVCAEELDSLRVVASRLALDVPQIEPPAGLRRDVMAAVRAEPNAGATVVKTSAPRTAWRLWPSLAGALAVAVVALGVWNINLRNDGGRTRLETVALAPNLIASTDVSTKAGRRVVVMRLDGLGAPPHGKGYEVWVIPPGGAPVSRGFMERLADGSHVAVVDVSGTETLAVTPEARTNTNAPTGQKLAVFST